MKDDSETFPRGFLFGTASSAYQCEGGNSWSDWAVAEAAEGRTAAPRGRKLAEACGEAADFWNRYRSDFVLAREVGSGIHRISIEWSRVVPSPDTLNREALLRYRDMVLAMRERGIEPMVCLHHFTLPAWIAKRGGLLSRRLVLAEFGRFVRSVIDVLGNSVSWWVTVNEPGILATCSYLAGTFPPFKKNYIAYRYALNTLLSMHRLASGMLREAVPQVKIGAAHAFTYVKGMHRGNLFEKALAALVSAHMNGLVFAGMPRSSLDFFGINYYGPNYVSGFSLRPSREGDPVTDMGWSIDPAGLVEGLRWAWTRYGLPLLVTENGIATENDAFRIEYLRAHLSSVLSALREGIGVVGYMHWALTDNFEWAEGFSKRFGLIGVDYATQVRTVRRSGRWFAELSRSGRLPELQTQISRAE